MNSNTDLEETIEQSIEVDSFADALANDLVEEGIVDGCIEVVFQEELTESQSELLSNNLSLHSSPSRTTSSLSNSGSDSSGNCEIDATKNSQLTSAGSRVISRAFKLFAWLFKPNTMARILLIVALVICGGNLFNFIRDAYSQPKIVQARAARPFFSNGSAKYLADYYHGNMRPEYALKATDLLIVMYYAQWSTESSFMKRVFEVNARMFSNKRSIKFIAINCWPVGSVCKSTYKITKFPIIAAYSNTVSLAYDGEHSIDHLHRWLRGLLNPILAVHSIEELTHLKAKYEKTVVAYFPFKNMQTPDGYRAFAAAGMILHNGKSKDYSNMLAFTNDLSLARSLQLRYEGDIVMFKHDGNSVYYPTIPRVAFKIVDWVRKEHMNSSLTWIHRNRNDNLFTEQLAKILNDTAVILLSDKFEAIYSTQNPVGVFQQVSEEYWQCHHVSSASSYNEPSTCDNENTYEKDSQFCEDTLSSGEEIFPCCRSLLSSVDWNVACASSAKYKWEGEPEVVEGGKRRSHWVDEHIPLTSECESKRNTTSANSIVHRCCNIYDTLGNRELTDEQDLLKKSNVAREQQNKLDGCMWSKLMTFLNYNRYELDQETDVAVANSSIRGYGCSKNSSLKFIVLDTNSYDYILKKLGKLNEQKPRVFIIDIGKEIILPMTTKFSREALKKFINEYHSLPVQSSQTTEDEHFSRFSNSQSNMDLEMKNNNEHQKLIRTNRSSFIHIVKNAASSSDEVVFFTGGRWHAPSVTAIHVYHQITRYFSKSTELIKFYTVDANRNDLPYNFNFDKLPAVVLFLSGRRDISWKYPESLPFSLTNMLSFILSRSSPQLRWHTALSRCGNVCKTQNIHRLRRHRDVVLRDIRLLAISNNNKREYYRHLRERRIAQLVTLSFTIRKMKQFEVSNQIESIKSMLTSREFKHYFSLLN